MVDSIVSVDSVTVTGGPATVNLEVDFGSQGDRGSLILYGLGEPTQANLPQAAQLLDWYINLAPNDPYYLWIYQYVNKGNVNAWERIFNIVPNTFHINKTLTFVDGVAMDGIIPSVSIVVDNTTLPLLPLQQIAGLALNCHVDLEPNWTAPPENPMPAPISVGFKLLQPDVVGTQLVLPMMITAVEAYPTEAGIIWGPVQGERTAHISLNVVGVDDGGES